MPINFGGTCTDTFFRQFRQFQYESLGAEVHLKPGNDLMHCGLLFQYMIMLFPSRFPLQRHDSLPDLSYIE